MTIRDRLFRRFLRLSWVSRRLKAFRPGPGGVGFQESQFSGETYDYTYLELAMKVNPMVGACVKAIANAIKAIPFRVMIENNRGRDAEREEVFSGDPVGGDLVDLFWRPNLKTSGTDLLEEIAAYMALDGEGLAFVDNGNAETQTPSGRPVHLQILKPRFIKSVEFLENGQVKHYVYDQHAATVNIAPEFVVHAKQWNPFDDGRALPPVEVAKHPVLLKWYMTRYAEKFFVNDATPSGVLSSAHPLDADIKKENIAFWEEAHKGVENSHRIAHLDGDTTYQPIGATNKDTEYLGLNDLTADEILAVFGVAPVVVGRFKWANYANSKEQIRIFYEFTVVPMAQKIANAFNTQFVDVWWPGTGLYIEPDFRDVDALQEDANLRARRHSIYLNTGVLSPNEVRLELGYPARDEGGDDYKPLAPTFGGLLGADGAPITKRPRFSVADLRRVRATLEEINGTQFRAVLAPTRDDQWKAFDRQAMIGERSVADVMAEFFIDQSKRVLDALDQVFVDELSAGRLVSSVKAVTPEQLFAIFDLDAEDAALREAVLPVMDRIIGQGGNGALAAIGSGVEFNAADPRVQELLSGKVMNLAGHVTATTKEKLRSVLVDSTLENMSVSQTASAIRDMFQDFSRTRALTIARTEVVGANNGAAIEGYRQSNVVPKKEWLSVQDSLVRDTHQIDTEQVALNDVFSNGLRFPGDQRGAAAEVVNCRCTVLPVLED